MPSGLFSHVVPLAISFVNSPFTPVCATALIIRMCLCLCLNQATLFVRAPAPARTGGLTALAWEMGVGLKNEEGGEGRH